MTIHSPLLSICIPTWNRAQLLNELLVSLEKQIVENNLQVEIEVFISDNHSEDKTPEIIQSFTNRLPFFRAERNSSNIGAKSNVLLSMEKANGLFCMVLGDDDRLNAKALPEILNRIKENPDTGILFDLSHSKLKKSFPHAQIPLELLVEKFYWNLGNAGCFITRSAFFKTNLQEKGYAFFNECWPQTQIMLLGMSQAPQCSCLVFPLNVHADSVHGEVMAYNSYYLWRTCLYDLWISLLAIKSEISPTVSAAAQKYIKHSMPQQLFNILQCGIFVDDLKTRKKTIAHISSNKHLFKEIGTHWLSLIQVCLFLPPFITKPISNISILLLKGEDGIRKKNEFVNNEKNKRVKANLSIRELHFEKS